MASKGTPVTEQDEQQIVELIDQGLSRNAVCRQVHRSHDLVSKVAAKHGRSFDRSQMAVATAAAREDAAAKRAKLSDEALTRAQGLVDQMGKPYTLRQFTSKGELVEVQVPGPPAEQQERLARAASMLAKSHLDLAARDSKPEGEAPSLLTSLARLWGLDGHDADTP